jgi:hypothetical protein
MFPAIQGGAAPAPGYYVSTTAAITHPGFDPWDQYRYVNAETIPYAAWAGWWHGFGVEKGDVGLAIRRNTGAFSPFVFADVGTGRVGEVSRKLFETLTPERNNEDLFLFLVFPRSGRFAGNHQFTSEPVIQSYVMQSIRQLNRIPGNDSIVEFLELDAKIKKFERKIEVSDTNVELQRRFWGIMNALIECGYQSN